jgi:hypothetical protein
MGNGRVPNLVTACTPKAHARSLWLTALNVAAHDRSSAPAWLLDPAA